MSAIEIASMKHNLEHELKKVKGAPIATQMLKRALSRLQKVVLTDCKETKKIF